MKLDFTLDIYSQLCKTIVALDCPVMTMHDFLVAGQPQGKRIILRHDVDRQINAALRMAELEATYGISATYYVRKMPATFKPEALKRLFKLGHEVGYHYEVLSKTKGNKEKAIDLFEQELRKFRKLIPVYTISMHGSPLSPWNNLDLWKNYDFNNYAIIGDATISIDKKLHYLTDTGRSWNAHKYNLRDRMNSQGSTHEINSTANLIDFLKSMPNTPIYISAHPNRWSNNYFVWSLSATSDWLINQVKWTLSTIRSRRI